MTRALSSLMSRATVRIIRPVLPCRITWPLTLVVTVLGHERMTMPDGSKRNCWVLNPVLDEPNGMFSKKAWNWEKDLMGGQ